MGNKSTWLSLEKDIMVWLYIHTVSEHWADNFGTRTGCVATLAQHVHIQHVHLQECLRPATRGLILLILQFLHKQSETVS